MEAATITKTDGNKMKAIYKGQEHEVTNLTQYSVELEGVKKSVLVAQGTLKPENSAEIVKQELPANSIIQVIGRRWFERTNGNTYHSAVLLVNGEHIGKESFTYGYGDQYIQTGRAILLNAFNVAGLDTQTPLWSLRELGHKFNSSVSDVARKKDL